MLETTLLTGPYDWDDALLPQAEFEARIAATRAVLRQRGLDGLFVGGSSPEHGALGYLTGFVPKLGPALAFVPADGDLRLAFSGGAAMSASAQRLTFIRDVAALRDPQNDAAAFIRKAGGTGFGLCGEDAIPTAFRQALDRAVPSPLVPLDAELNSLRRHKSPRELVLLVRACEILGLTIGELRAASREGAGVRSAALRAERMAYASGAQDMRILLGRRDGGVPEPLIGANDPKVDPLLVCVGVRFAGYWAEGLATITANPDAALAAAEAALTAMLKEAGPSVAWPLLRTAAARAAAGMKIHTFVAASIGNGIGMSREETEAALQEGDVCTLRAGFQAAGTDAAIASAMIRIGKTGAEVLWR